MVAMSLPKAVTLADRNNDRELPNNIQRACFFNQASRAMRFALDEKSPKAIGGWNGSRLAN
jgi:hypothetical protein